MNISAVVHEYSEKFKKYWKTPPEGRYMPYKEIASLSGGGIGVRFVSYCVSQMIISTTNTLIGNTIGIDPTALYVIYIISLISAFPLTALRAKMIDNTRSMKGKYRPYIITMGIPTVILGVLFMWMPYESMSLFMKCATVLLFNIGFQFFYNFYIDAYDSLINVLSPNSIERSDVLSIRCIVENLSPSIVSIFLPIFAKLITGEDTLFDLKIYRILFPPLIFIGFLISLVVYVNTKEKIIQAKSHFIQVKFADAFRAIARNKYFWIISLAGWLGFLEGAFGNIMQWMYNYQGACSAVQYSVITAIAGNASFWPNIIAPFFIRKYGKKKILVFTNTLNIALIAVMLPVVRMTGQPGIIWFMLACTFINTLITSLGHLLTPSINADIRDYQQYISGERIDGMFAAVSLIGNIITMVTGLVLPVIYEKAGLNRGVALSLGYDGSNVYDVLYNREYFISISSVLIIASIVGAAMNVIPYFFFDFTETKQKAVVRVLKIRAYSEDTANGENDEITAEEVKEIIKTAYSLYGKKPHDLKELKKQLRRSKKTLSKEAYKAEKALLKEKAKENEEIEIAEFIIKNELTYFTSDAGETELKNAKNILSAGINGFFNAELPKKSEIKKLPHREEQEKLLRTNALHLISDIKTAKRTAKKYYPNGIEEFDKSVFEKLFAAEDENEIKLNSCAKALKASKESGENTAELKKQYKDLQYVKAQIKKEIKKATNQNSIYHRCAKPYLDAKRLVERAESYEQIRIM